MTASIAIIVPTLNAAEEWGEFMPPLLASVKPDDVLILDSSSTDGTAELAHEAGFRVHTIPRSEFNHGGTRQLALLLMPDADILLFLTQDAILANSNSIALLLEAFRDKDVVAAFGRQMPRNGAAAIETHARLFNYSTHSNIRSLNDRTELGFKTIFFSNSFGAYRRTALEAVGGFPSDVIFGEDTITIAKLLLAGGKVAYVAEAEVLHSHAYTWRQEFRRYFDIGVLHTRESWLLREFGNASGEGGRFVRSELSYLWLKDARLIPSAVVRTALKLLGYKLGRKEGMLSLGWKRRLSMHRDFWQ